MNYKMGCPNLQIINWKYGIQIKIGQIPEYQFLSSAPGVEGGVATTNNEGVAATACKINRPLRISA